MTPDSHTPSDAVE